MIKKISDLFKEYIFPITVFSGGMIGVGFLSLPYVASRVGIWVMLAYFVIITALVVTINLIFSQISLKTPDLKRFPGFVGYHLGKYAKAFTLTSVILGTIGVLLVYLIIGGQFLNTALRSTFGGNAIIYTLLYFIVASLIIYFDIKIISRVEFWILGGLIFSLIIIFLQNLSYFKLGHIFYFNFETLKQNIFLPYGPLLFSLWGISLIPETEEMLRGKKQNLKKIVLFSTIAVSVFYFLFVVFILGMTGSTTTESALTGLQRLLEGKFILITLLIGAITTFAAFIMQGIVLKKVFMYDLGVKHWHAFVMTCFTPMVLFLLGLNTFIGLISFVGGVMLSIDGIFILLMYKKIGGKKYIIYSLSLVFLVGLIYEIFYFIK